MGIVLPLYHLSLVLLSISFSHVEHRNLVLADESLIQLQCHNAEVPSTCIQCVKSDPRSKTADKVGIAAIVISCLNNSAKVLSGNMSALASAEHDKKVKQVLLGCEIGFSEAETYLIRAKAQLENKDYDGTNSLIREALEHEVDCHNDVLDYKSSVPDSVIYDMRVYEELSDAAMRIIDSHVGHRNIVLAGESLIQLQCHNAEVPSTCIQCLKSEPRSKIADKVGIAVIVISCLSNSAKVLSGNMSALASAEHDKKVKQVLLGCEIGFSEAETYLTKAKAQLENKDYNRTNSFIGEALEHEVDCHNDVLGYKSLVPDSVIYDMRVYEELSDAAMRIIDRF
ncbi:hypothetical protein V6N13_087845 [Hibiscus sabdariffa]